MTDRSPLRRASDNATEHASRAVAGRARSPRRLGVVARGASRYVVVVPLAEPVSPIRFGRRVLRSRAGAVKDLRRHRWNDCAAGTPTGTHRRTAERDWTTARNGDSGDIEDSAAVREQERERQRETERTEQLGTDGRHFDAVQHVVDDGCRVDAADARVGGQDESVGERLLDNSFHVVWDGVVAAVEDRGGAGRLEQPLNPTWGDADIHAVVLAGGAAEFDDVVPERAVDGDRFDSPLERRQPLAVDDAGDAGACAVRSARRSMSSRSPPKSGYPIEVLTMKRSRWASGRPNVPSCSTGFCVAMTKKGLGSWCVSPSTVTCPSSIASRRAACVFGGARLISSARTTLAKMGPRSNTKSRLASRIVSVPVMSDGIRSGVNCTRPKERTSAVANDWAVSVFPVPGTSSSRT